jgi:hypothetical protein
MFAAGSLPGAEPPLVGRGFADDVAPFVVKYCADCHGPTKQSGGLSLTEFKSGDDFARARDTWSHVLTRLRGGEMPPAMQPQPTAVERARLVAWLERNLRTAGSGRVTLRRLNRVEYANTVRELFGTDFRPAEGFPLDDVGYGFDNIGDVLSLSPLLFEKYMAAADAVLAGVFTKVQRVRPTMIHVRGHEGSLRAAGRFKVVHADEARIVYSGDVVRTFRLEHAGRYVLRIQARSEPHGGEWPRVTFRVNGRDAREVEIRPAKADQTTMPKSRPFEARVELTAGAHDIGFALVNPTGGGAEARWVKLVALEVEGPLDPPPPEPSDAYRKIVAVQPGPDLSRAEATRRVLVAFVRRAYRRQPTSAELDKLAELAGFAERQGDTFDDGLRLAFKAVLASPHFLFKVETDPPGAEVGSAYPLRETELATRLAYFLWSAPPDDGLLELAVAGRLRTGEALREQVRRMLADPRSRALADNFAGQWLQVRNLQSVAIDPATFPSFDEPLRAAMAEETLLFFDAIVREERSVREFLDAEFTFVNERLARHYGMTGVRGSHFRRVSVRGTRRAGMLTQAGILTVTSNPTRTSPVKRGKFLLENILGTPVPPPPPDVPDLAEGHELTGTLRQRLEQHRVNPACASCHDRMDPPGFAFENYDAIGAWRTTDGGKPVDSSGTLPDGRAFRNAEELRDLLRANPEPFRRCLVEKLLTYAIGRGLDAADRGTIDDICRRMAEHGDRFSAMVLAIVESPAFQTRVATGGRQ